MKRKAAMFGQNTRVGLWTLELLSSYQLFIVHDSHTHIVVFSIFVLANEYGNAALVLGLQIPITFVRVTEVSECSHCPVAPEPISTLCARCSFGRKATIGS